MKTRILLSVAILLAGVAGTTPAHADGGGDPIGAFDFVSRFGPSKFGAVDARNWIIGGWAADEDAPGQAIQVHVYLDGQQINGTYTGPSAGFYRPDVAAAYPFAGDHAGWQEAVSVRDDAPHTVCAYAINVGNGTQNTTLGCKTFQSGPPDPGDPRGWVDQIAPDPGVVRIQGWSGDPDPGADQPTIDTYLDGVPFVSLRATLPRGDVQAVFPDLHNAAGFDESLPVLPGLHILCIDTINSGGTGSNNPSLGCWLVDVPDVQPAGPDKPNGAFDGIVFHEQNGEGDTPYTLEGWAWVPGAQGPYTVRDRFVDNYPLSFWSGYTTHTVDGTTGEARPDVPQAFPGAPPDTGYKIASYIPNGTLFPLAPRVAYHCMYLVTWYGEKFLGCRNM